MPSQELDALNDFFVSTNGDWWRWKIGPKAGNHWSFSANANPCEPIWQGINCTRSTDETMYYISAIHLPQYNLSGTLPESIGTLSQLTFLSLEYNKIHQQLPNAIGNLTLLSYLSITNNLLTGSVPESIGALQQLQALYLEYNYLSEQLPDSIGNCTALRHLSFYNNTIRGTIPNTLGQLTNLEDIDFGDNYIKGTIPDSLELLVNLTSLKLNTNLLEGAIPASLGNLPNLRTLLLSNNFIAGSIPSTIGNISTLVTFQANFNYITGTLPDSLCNLLELKTLQAYNNQINGTIPQNIGNLFRLQELGLNSNRLRGTIPDSLGNLHRLSHVYVNKNVLSGTIPQTLDGLHSIQYLNLYANRLTGTIPSNLGSLTLMTDLGLDTNLLTSTIPTSLGNLTILRSLYLSGNRLTGTIPTALAQLNVLQGLFLYNNHLIGTIPLFITTLSQLRDVELGQNKLTGTIPTQFSDLHFLQFLYLQEAYLTGTIPSSLGSLKPLQFLSVANNFLEGTIPVFANAQNLREVQLQHNHLSGSLHKVFNSSVNTNLQTIVLASNRLTGSLPPSLFALPNVNTLVVVENCISGKLPSTLCHNTNMKSLILDGLSSASVCRNYVIPGVKSSYAITTSVYGTVPACLFTLPQLSSLHMSGNGFTGPLPNLDVISESLIDVSLSHNKLTGSVPLSIQQRQWYNLDLSYNRLAGTLSSDFASELIVYDPNYIPVKGLTANYSVETSLSLENNRISGNIPNSIAHLTQISILGSNVFACSLDQSDLPTHDNDRNSYVCGSVAFDIPYYIWLVMFGVWVAVLVFVYATRKRIKMHAVFASYVEIVEKWLEYSSSKQEQKSALNVFNSVIEVLCRVSGFTAVYVLCILLPLFCILSPYYGVMTHQYAWGVSGAFLSGLLPAMLEFVILMCLLLCTVALFAKLVTPRLRHEAKSKADRASARFSATIPGRLTRSSSLVGGFFRRTSSLFDTHATLKTVNTDAGENNNATATSTVESAYGVQLKKTIIYIIYIAINMFVVFGVNVAYVYVTIYEDSAYHVLAQILLSLFKLMWNSICTSIVLRSVVSYITGHDKFEKEKYSENEFVSLQVIIALVNNIGIPCLVVAVISPNCFYSVFVPAPKVESMYTYESCQVYNVDTGDCSEYLPAVGDSTYSPPYRYNYQCSFSLVTFYSPAFVSLCIVATFLAPLAQLTLLFLHGRATPGTVWYRVLHMMLPRIFKPIAQNAEEAHRDSEISKQGFDKTYFKANQVRFSDNLVCK